MIFNFFFSSPTHNILQGGSHLYYADNVIRLVYLSWKKRRDIRVSIQEWSSMTLVNNKIIPGIYKRKRESKKKWNKARSLPRKRVFFLFFLTGIIFLFFHDRFLARDRVFFLFFSWSLSLVESVFTCFLTILFWFTNSQLRPADADNAAGVTDVQTDEGRKKDGTEEVGYRDYQHPKNGLDTSMHAMHRGATG